MVYYDKVFTFKKRILVNNSNNNKNYREAPVIQVICINIR